MKEIWKNIENYDGYYKISNLGRIKSTKIWTGSTYIEKEKMLKPQKQSNGYLIINLKGKKKLIHRLVAENFIPNLNNKPIVNHKNGIKTDNQIYNLEWCDYAYNEKEAYRIGIKKPCRKIVLQLDLNNNIIREWESLTQIKKELGYSTGIICDVCYGKRKKAYYSKWKYKEDFYEKEI